METLYDVPYVRTVDAGVANRVYVDWKFENRSCEGKKTPKPCTLIITIFATLAVQQCVAYSTHK